MKKLFLITGLMFSLDGLVHATEITNINATGTTFTFTATLNSPLTTGNKVKIDFGNGGLNAMTCSAKTCTLSSNALPSGIGTATYKIGIYDATNVLQGSTSDGTYIITSNSSAPVSNYTKIANDGSELSDSVKLGANPKDWACTKDNKTGLMWEVKTTDGGLRDKDWTYNRYDKLSGLAKCFGSDCNALSYIKSVNQKGLCGLQDWRLPSKEELGKLVYCSDNKYRESAETALFSQNSFYICENNVNQSITGNFDIAALNTTYFADIGMANWFWSSSVVDRTNENVANVIFVKNNGSWYGKGGDYSAIRLVR